MSVRIVQSCLLMFILSLFAVPVLHAQQAVPASIISLPEKDGIVDVYFFKQVDIPQGKIVRAWSAIHALHEYVLYINGREASRSRYGRVPSDFRIAEEIENLAPFFKPGENTLVVKARRWSPGTPVFRFESEVQVETAEGIVPVSIVSDATWVGSYMVPEGWTSPAFKPSGWMEVTATPGDHGRRGPRITKEQQPIIKPDIAAPLLESVLKVIPQIRDMSVWSQQVVARDREAEINRLMELYHTRFIAERLAQFTVWSNTHMGDSFSINGYPVGNGIVFTTVGLYPFYNTTWTLGPEYQYPVQWNPGSTFAGDNVQVFSGEQPLDLRNQWFWKILGTDVTVAAAADPAGKTVFYALTLAPPELKALIRIYVIANASESDTLSNVVIRNRIHRAKPDGNTLVETVLHHPIADAAGDKNTRTMISGILDENAVRAYFEEQGNNGVLDIAFGDIAPGDVKKHLLYHVTFLETVNDKPVESTAPQTLVKVKERNYSLLDDTIKYWRDYNETTTNLSAPGLWGRRVADYIDDVKMLVQVQQFERTGAVGPMWFFSDQWIRDACGPVKSYLRTGRLEEARRVLTYHYLSSIACRKILNWLPMDVDIFKDWPPVEDWSQITMNYADRHANCEVPSWVIIKHYWYFKFSGDTKTISDHWEYLKRCYYGQFDNEYDKIFRPDFKIPFHGDETYIYSGGEALWENRYDLTQNSYPGGNIYSADSSFELVAAGDALIEMGRIIGKTEDANAIADVNAKIREATERYYWMDDLGFYAQGMSVLFDGQLNRFPMANILANVIWCGYSDAKNSKTVSNALKMMEYLMEDTGVLNPIVGYDVTVGMLQGQGLYTLSAINHPWAEKAFYALLMIAGDTTEYSEWMAPGWDYRTMFRANRIRPWEAGINLDALLYYLSGFEPDAYAKKMALAPKLPTGVYSPVKWDEMTLKNLPMGRGMYDLTVKDSIVQRMRARNYTIVSRSPDAVTVDFKAVIPFANIDQVRVNGRTVRVRPVQEYGQAVAVFPVGIPAGSKAQIAVTYRPTEPEPVKVELKEFTPPKPHYEESDIVLYTLLRPDPNRPLLRDELSRKYKVLPIDASLPTDPGVFEGALLSRTGIKTKMLILTQDSMSFNRKPTFWYEPEFDRIIGEFIKRGGIVLEANSRNPSSRWLEETLAPAKFSVNYQRGENAIALDGVNEDLDKAYYWLDEKQAEAAGKWSGYWAGNYEMKYLGGDSVINDRVLIWGTQEQPHGCMQYNMKTNPGKDHLIRIRTWPYPKKGFTLQVTEDNGNTWNVIETIWVPQPEDTTQNGWMDVYMTLPAKYVTKEETIFRIGSPEGSSGGIGYEGYHSTGAARIWIRDNLEKPPSMAEINTSSALAGKLGLPDKGIVGFSNGMIDFEGFTAPYRLLGASTKAALILKPVGNGLYIKSELTAHFPIDKMTKFIDTLMDPVLRKAALSGL